MQDRYAGDVGDFGKFGMLRWSEWITGELPYGVSVPAGGAVRAKGI